MSWFLWLSLVLLVFLALFGIFLFRLIRPSLGYRMEGPP